MKLGSYLKRNPFLNNKKRHTSLLFTSSTQKSTEPKKCVIKIVVTVYGGFSETRSEKENA